MGRLTWFDRQRIEHYVRLGRSVRAIARLIGRDHSVVSRELKRNNGQFSTYEANKANYYSQRRAKRTNRRKLVKYKLLGDYVRARLWDKWSPEQIAGRLKSQPPAELKGLKVSYEAIYQWIYDEAKGEPWLYHHLRRKHYVRHLKYSRERRTPGPIKYLVCVTERPLTNELGHFEIDSLVGRRHKSALSVHYERASQLVKIHPLKSLEARGTKEAIEATLETLQPGFVKSLTFDRGRETAFHYQLREPYKLQTYHCQPYKAYQKGGVENAIGLLRQYFPKGTDFHQVSPQTIQAAEAALNNRPRKSLQFRTPNEIIQQSGALNS